MALPGAVTGLSTARRFAGAATDERLWVAPRSWTSECCQSDADRL